MTRNIKGSSDEDKEDAIRERKRQTRSRLEGGNVSGEWGRERRERKVKK